MTANTEFKKLRKGLKLTQIEFAEKINMSQGTITDIERGRIPISKKVSDKIIEVFGLKPEEMHSISDKWNSELQKNNTENLRSKSAQSGAQVAENNDNKDRTLPHHDELMRLAGLYGTYLTMFNKVIGKELPEAVQFTDDLYELARLNDLVHSFFQTKIAAPWFLNGGNNFKIKTYDEFEEYGRKTYKEALAYKDILHEFAKAVRKFKADLKLIKAEIGLDYHFVD